MEDQNATSEKIEQKPKKKGWATKLLLKVEEKLKGSKGKHKKKCTGLETTTGATTSTPTGCKLLRARSGIEFGVDPNKEEMRNMGEMPPTNWISSKTFKRTHLVPECPPRKGLAL